MFNKYFFEIAVVMSGVCVASLSSTLFVLYTRAGQINYPIDEDWRDPAPKYVALARRFFDGISNQLATGYIEHSMSEKTRNQLDQMLSEAGYSYSILPAEIIMARWTSLLAGVLITTILMMSYGFSGLQACTVGAVMAALFYRYPDKKLQKQGELRKLEIERHFPFFLDTLVLMIGAGIPPKVALSKAVRLAPKGPIKQEFSRVDRDIKANIPYPDALQNLAKRVRSTAVSSFVATCCQADKKGTSLTGPLGEQAKQRRRERFRRAEELAGKAQVKLMGPIALFLFPILFFFIVVPIVMDLSSSGLFPR